MKGNERIAGILRDDYGIKDLSTYENIEYEIQKFSDDISRVVIKSSKEDALFCPVYAMFDGYHMSWYGDYGSFVFDCTWKTNVMNLAYESPYYQLEKLDSRKHREFNETQCEEELIKTIKSGDWYNETLNDEQRKRFDEFIETPYDYISYDDILYEYEDICNELQSLLKSTQDEYEWISAIRKIDFDEYDASHIFGCECYELYDIGDKAPVRFFIILYMLSVVRNLEKELQK